MVFFAEIAFIYRGNNSSEDVFGSEKSSEKIIKSSGDIHTIENKRKTYKIRFKCDFCEKTTKIALKNGLNIYLGNILLI